MDVRCYFYHDRESKTEKNEKTTFKYRGNKSRIIVKLMNNGFPSQVREREREKQTCMYAWCDEAMQTNEHYPNNMCKKPNSCKKK